MSWEAKPRRIRLDLRLVQLFMLRSKRAFICRRPRAAAGGRDTLTRRTARAARAHARGARHAHARHAPLNQSHGRRALRARAYGNLTTNSTRHCATSVDAH